MSKSQCVDVHLPHIGQRPEQRSGHNVLGYQRERGNGSKCTETEDRITGWIQSLAVGILESCKLVY